MFPSYPANTSSGTRNTGNIQPQQQQPQQPNTQHTQQQAQQTQHVTTPTGTSNNKQALMMQQQLAQQSAQVNAQQQYAAQQRAYLLQQQQQHTHMGHAAHAAHQQHSQQQGYPPLEAGGQLSIVPPSSSAAVSPVATNEQLANLTAMMQSTANAGVVSNAGAGNTPTAGSNNMSNTVPPRPPNGNGSNNSGHASSSPRSHHSQLAAALHAQQAQQAQHSAQTHMVQQAQAMLNSLTQQQQQAVNVASRESGAADNPGTPGSLGISSNTAASIKAAQYMHQSPLLNTYLPHDPSAAHSGGRSMATGNVSVQQQQQQLLQQQKQLLQERERLMREQQQQHQRSQAQQQQHTHMQQQQQQQQQQVPPGSHPHSHSQSALQQRQLSLLAQQQQQQQQQQLSHHHLSQLDRMSPPTPNQLNPAHLSFSRVASAASTGNQSGMLTPPAPGGYRPLPGSELTGLKSELTELTRRLELQAKDYYAAQRELIDKLSLFSQMMITLHGTTNPMSAVTAAMAQRHQQHRQATLAGQQYLSSATMGLMHNAAQMGVGDSLYSPSSLTRASSAAQPVNAANATGVHPYLSHLSHSQSLGSPNDYNAAVVASAVDHDQSNDSQSTENSGTKGGRKKSTKKEDGRGADKEGRGSKQAMKTSAANMIMANAQPVTATVSNGPPSSSSSKSKGVNKGKGGASHGKEKKSDSPKKGSRSVSGRGGGSSNNSSTSNSSKSGKETKEKKSSNSSTTSKSDKKKKNTSTKAEPTTNMQANMMGHPANLSTLNALNTANSPTHPATTLSVPSAVGIYPNSNSSLLQHSSPLSHGSANALSRQQNHMSSSSSYDPADPRLRSVSPGLSLSYDHTAHSPMAAPVVGPLPSRMLSLTPSRILEDSSMDHVLGLRSLNASPIISPENSVPIVGRLDSQEEQQDGEGGDEDDDKDDMDELSLHNSPSRVSHEQHSRTHTLSASHTHGGHRLLPGSSSGKGGHDHSSKGPTGGKTSRAEANDSDSSDEEEQDDEDNERSHRTHNTHTNTSATNTTTNTTTNTSNVHFDGFNTISARLSRASSAVSDSTTLLGDRAIGDEGSRKRSLSVLHNSDSQLDVQSQQSSSASSAASEQQKKVKRATTSTGSTDLDDGHLHSPSSGQSSPLVSASSLNSSSDSHHSLPHSPPSSHTHNHEVQQLMV